MTEVNSGNLELAKFELPPALKAHLEILNLWREFSSQSQVVIGGPTPPEMEAENAKLWAEYNRQKTAILAKYGVASTD